MSTALDARRRPNLWSYISFGTPRRRSITLPKPNGNSPEDREEALRSKIWGDEGYQGASTAFKDASMTGGQRARLLKIGGVLTLIVFLYYIFSSRDSASVRDLVNGKLKSRFMCFFFYLYWDLTPAPRTSILRFKIATIFSRATYRCAFQFFKDNEVLEVWYQRKKFDTVCINDRCR